MLYYANLSLIHSRHCRYCKITSFNFVDEWQCNTWDKIFETFKVAEFIKQRKIWWDRISVMHIQSFSRLTIVVVAWLTYFCKLTTYPGVRIPFTIDQKSLLSVKIKFFYILPQCVYCFSISLSCFEWKSILIKREFHACVCKISTLKW